MENWNMVALLAALGFNLAAGAWHLVAAIRHDRKAARLDRETYEVRPLLPEGAAEVVRPGDALIIVIPEHHERNKVYVKALTERAKALSERGIKLVVFQEFMLKKNLILVAGESTEGEKVAARLAHRLNGSVSGNGGADS